MDAPYASLARHSIDHSKPQILRAKRMSDNMIAVFFYANGMFYVAGTTKLGTAKGPANIEQADPTTWIGIRDFPPTRLDLVNLYPLYLINMTKLTAGLLDPKLYIKRPSAARGGSAVLTKLPPATL
jgi:hypothetical protein